jgi:adenylate cyclase
LAGIIVSKMNRRGSALALIGVLAFAIVAVLLWHPSPSLPVIGDWEWPLYDSHLQAAAREKPLTLAESPVVIVAMDDDTPLNLKLALGEDFEDPFYPLPRSFHADVLRKLERAKVKAIGFDLLFTEESDEDGLFLSALKTRTGTLAATRPLLHKDGVETFTEIAPLLTEALTPASIEVPRSQGRSVRFIPTLVQDQGSLHLDRHIPHLGIALVAAGEGFLAQPPQLTGGYFRWAKHRLPLATSLGESTALIRFQGPEKTFPMVRYDNIFLSSTLPSELEGKLVLIGRYSTLEDRHMTPVGEMTGVELLANIAYMTSTQSGLRTTEAWSLWIGLALSTAFLGLTWRFTLFPALLGALLLGSGWGWLAHTLFLRTGVWWETATPLLQLGLAVALAVPYEIVRAHRAFKTQVSASAARSALSGRGMQLGTREVYVTVVFCDIRGFTSFCETHNADEVEAMLRAYFEAGDSAARRFGSELDKFMGDAILLYFFELPKQEPGAVRAVRWAWELQQAADRIGIQLGVGISSGLAREGFIGTPGRMQRTVIGDVVNLASRLQEATKTLQTPILLDEGSASQLGEYLLSEPLGEIIVRGKQQPVQVYRPAPLHDSQK